MSVGRAEWAVGSRRQALGGGGRWCRGPPAVLLPPAEEEALPGKRCRRPRPLPPSGHAGRAGALVRPGAGACPPASRVRPGRCCPRPPCRSVSPGGDKSRSSQCPGGLQEVSVCPRRPRPGSRVSLLAGVQPAGARERPRAGDAGPAGTHRYSGSRLPGRSPDGALGSRNRRVGLGRGRRERGEWEEPRDDVFVPTPECEDQCKVTPRNDSASARPADRFGMGCAC